MLLLWCYVDNVIVGEGVGEGVLMGLKMGVGSFIVGVGEF